MCVRRSFAEGWLCRLYERLFELLEEGSIVVESRRTLGRDQLMTHVSGDLWGHSGEDQGRKTISLGIEHEQIQASWAVCLAGRAWVDVIVALFRGGERSCPNSDI